MPRAGAAAGLVALAAGLEPLPKCPGSAAFVHASCSVEATTSASCTDVVAEIQARVAGQYAAWHDPHNNGTYAIKSQNDQELLLTRTSGSKSVGGTTYTDKVLFTFSSSGAGCSIGACSESQVTSVADFSTNYCNIRNLYCGSADGCKPVEHDFDHKEVAVSPSFGAGKDPSKCVVAGEVAVRRLEPAGVVEAPSSLQAGVVEAPTSDEGPCCNKTCPPPLVKYFSVDAPHGFCGETCINPRSYPLFHVFEANLTKAEHEQPCQSLLTPSNTRRYTDYFSTVTHGDPFGVLKVTLDLYAPTKMPNHTCCITHPRGPSCPATSAPLSIFGTGPFCCPFGGTEEAPCPLGAPAVEEAAEEASEATPLGAVSLVGAPGAAEEGPCCNKTCPPPLAKYFSVDAPHGFCGETCINPSSYPLFHFFEANLTKAEHEQPCQSLLTPSNTRQYTDYFSTVTHGDPFGVLKVTLDLYAPTKMPDHSCCTTLPDPKLMCTVVEKPALISVFGTGPFCCPAGATEEVPCPSAAAQTLLV